jgi:hypothetical protein
VGNTLTVGVDDTGYDVKLFGATAGAYALWDESADDLKLVGGAGLVQSGAGANTLTGATTLSSTLAVSGASTLSGAVSSGAITSSGIIKTDDATDATSTTDGSLQTDGGLSVVKDAVIGDDLKLLSDAAVLNFGADSDVTLTHDADDGLGLKSAATADDNPFLLTIQSGETDIAANDVIGTINFQAPDEGTGTDAILVAAGIEAVSEGDFSSSNNATKLSFKTGASEAATEKMALSSTGNLTVSGDVTVTGNDITFGNGETISNATDGSVIIGVGSANQLSVTDGTITPAVDNDIDLGSSSYEFKNLYVDGTSFADALGFGTVAMTVPTADGSSGQVLATNGSGTLSWATAGGASNVNGLSDGLVEDNSMYIGNNPSSTTSTAQYNLAVGTTALDAITTGDYNVAVGYDVLTDNTTGGHNTASGYRSLQNNTTGWGNTASGMQTLSFNTEGIGNVAIGYNSMLGNTQANYNTAIGFHSLYNTYSNSGANTYNVGLGYKAGDLISTGTNNTILGADSDPSVNSAENQIVVGYGVTGTGNNQIALGNTSITHIKAQVTSITGYSDSRIKRDIRNNDLGLSFINKLRTVKYRLKNPADYPLGLREKRFIDGKNVRPQDDEKIYDGLIAQEVKAAIDELGIEWSGWSKNDSDGKQGIQYGALTVPLIKAVQEQQAQIEILQRQYAQVTFQNQELMKLVSTQLLKKNDAEVKLIRSDESNNDDKSEAVITSMK